MYEVIGLKSTIPIDDIVNYVQDFDFDPYLGSVYRTMDDVAQRKLLSPEIEKNIKDLQTSEVSTLDLTTIKDGVLHYYQIKTTCHLKLRFVKKKYYCFVF